MHTVYTLSANASGWYYVEWDSDPGVRVVVPRPEHGSGHGHALEYSDHYVEIRENGKWRYWIKVTNKKSEEAHFRIRWTQEL